MRRTGLIALGLALLFNLYSSFVDTPYRIAWAEGAGFSAALREFEKVPEISHEPGAEAKPQADVVRAAKQLDMYSVLGAQREAHFKVVRGLWRAQGLNILLIGIAMWTLWRARPKQSASA